MELEKIANQLMTTNRLAFNDASIKTVPRRRGVYAAFESSDRLVSIGYSNNLYSRLRMHLIGPRREHPKKGPGSMLRNYAAQYRNLCPEVDASGVWTKYRGHQLPQYQPKMNAYIKSLTFTYLPIESKEVAKLLESDLIRRLKPEFNH